MSSHPDSSLLAPSGYSAVSTLLTHAVLATDMLSVGAQYAKTIEEKAVDATSAVGMGYSESKWVAERLLELAASKTTLHTVSIRVGQISGTSAGAWQRAEWFPSMIKSAVYLGYIPAADRVRERRTLAACCVNNLY